MATQQQLNNLKTAVENYLSVVKFRNEVTDFSIVESQEELDVALNQEQSFENVFNNWTRFSRYYQNGYVNNAIPSELTAWTYLSAQNTVRNTTNSTSYVGFISPTKHDDYVFEVTMKSTAGDDDNIGLVVATAMDEQNILHTLDVMACGNGASPIFLASNFAVEVDAHGAALGTPPNNPDFYYKKADTDKGLIWVDGTLYNGTAKGTGAAQNWNLIPNGVRVKVVRQGDIIEVYASLFNSTTLVSDPVIVVDLSSDPRLEKFRVPGHYGYSAWSQQNSTWMVHSRPGAREPIVDLHNGLLWTWRGTDWDSEPLVEGEDISILPKDKSFFMDPNSGRLYYYDSRAGISKIAD